MTIAQYRCQTENTRPGLQYSSSVAVVVTGREIIHGEFDRRDGHECRNEVFVYGRTRRGRGDRGERRVREMEREREREREKERGKEGRNGSEIRAESKQTKIISIMLDKSKIQIKSHHFPQKPPMAEER